MTTHLRPPAAAAPPHAFVRLGLLRGLDTPGDAVRSFGPNWFAAVMGTGIVGGAAATLPFRSPLLTAWATGVWGLASALLVVLVAAAVAHRVRSPERARAHAADPVAVQSYGAVAMAFMTVGAGAVQFGPAVLGAPAALATSAVLWLVGTVFGLVTAVGVPYLMITRHTVGPDAVSPAWLLPVVPPMVSAADGALLVVHLAPGQGRTTLLLACVALFGMSLFATLALLPQIWHRLVVHGTGPAAAVPTLWIVLGQSVTAAGLLANAAPGSVPEPYAGAAAVIAVVYGVPVWGFAMLWLALAAAVTLRTIRRGLPFTLTWWSFTFPLGTCVTGTNLLVERLETPALAVVATALYVLLVAAWLLVGARTVHGALARSEPARPA
ncbi:TDT family transporter [Pseudonocardia sp. ICBG1142]|uniref:TDT family transporter n=1 Tax=Pseudonocardia sp. ICBG1142 TaxID=2846760 RepID=UPI001CF68F31|nr:TDT family transporter [Pseudonocardia sp. ICBG1142]